MLENDLTRMPRKSVVVTKGILRKVVIIPVHPSSEIHNKKFSRETNEKSASSKKNLKTNKKKR